MNKVVVVGSASVDASVGVVIVFVVVFFPDFLLCFVSSVEKTFGAQTQVDNAHSFCQRR